MAFSLIIFFSFNAMSSKLCGIWYIIFYITVLGDIKNVEDMKKLLVTHQACNTFFLFKFTEESCLVHFTYWACFLHAYMVHKEKA